MSVPVSAFRMIFCSLECTGTQMLKIQGAFRDLSQETEADYRKNTQISRFLVFNPTLHQSVSKIFSLFLAMLLHMGQHDKTTQWAFNFFKPSVVTKASPRLFLNLNHLDITDDKGLYNFLSIFVAKPNQNLTNGLCVSGRRILFLMLEDFISFLLHFCSPKSP